MSDELRNIPGDMPDDAQTADTDTRQADTGTQPEGAPQAASPGESLGPSIEQRAGETASGAMPESVALEDMMAAPLASADARAAGAEPERAADPQLKAVIEALIFASPEPLTPKMLFKLLEGEPKEDVELAVTSLRQDYDGHGGLQIVEVAGGYQIVTRPEMSEWVRRLFHERKTQKLSVQALETLAVIAYKQPITGPEIAEIRGVNTGGVLNTLLDRHLIKISGRKAVVGRPFLYSTTREFLIRFGLRDLNDLPKVEDLADVLGFEPPAGLSDTPTEGRLPLEVANEAAAQADEVDRRDKGEQVH